MVLFLVDLLTEVDLIVLFEFLLEDVHHQLEVMLLVEVFHIFLEV